MSRSWAVAILKLSRADGALLAFLVFFVPCYVHSGDAPTSAAVAAPIGLIAICTFILNNINDLERDSVNHPSRPLPRGIISMRAAATAYFVVLAVTASAVYWLVPSWLQYWYLGSMVLCINYSTVVNNIPIMKNPYAAAGHALPVLLARAVCGPEALPLLLPPAVFFFSLGREILMDLRDVRGDGKTLVKLFPTGTVQVSAFLFQGIGILCLAACITNMAEGAAFAAIVATFVAFAIAAMRSVPISIIVNWMRIQFAAGIVFLF